MILKEKLFSYTFLICKFCKETKFNSVSVFSWIFITQMFLEIFFPFFCISLNESLGFSIISKVVFRLQLQITKCSKFILFILRQSFYTQKNRKYLIFMPRVYNLELYNKLRTYELIMIMLLGQLSNE